MIKIMPSTNPCPEDKLIDYVYELQKLDIGFLHCDVMDGHFVKNNCLPIQMVDYINQNSLIGLDVHLMCNNISKSIKQWCKIKPNIITVHYEAFDNIKDLLKVIEYIKSQGIMAGLSIKLDTPIENVKNLLPILDLILIMSVEVGYSGQVFNASTLSKIKIVKKIKDKNNLSIKIEVDGGINEDTAKFVIDAGADYLVMGSAFYNNKNREKLINKIKNA